MAAGSHEADNVGMVAQHDHQVHFLPAVQFKSVGILGDPNFPAFLQTRMRQTTPPRQSEPRTAFTLCIQI